MVEDLFLVTIKPFPNTLKTNKVHFIKIMKAGIHFSPHQMLLSYVKLYTVLDKAMIDDSNNDNTD